MPELHGSKLIGSVGKQEPYMPAEKTGAQILAQPLAGGILFPSATDETPEAYSSIWGDFTDYPCFPACDLNAPANDAFGLGNTWNFFYTRRAIWYRRIRSMRRDPTINLARILSVAPILSAGWDYVENGDAPDGAKEFIEKEIEPYRLHLIQTGLLNCIDFGWQSYEKVFEYLKKDGKIHVKKLKPLLPDLTHIRVNQNTGEFVGLQQFQNFASVERNSIINLDLEASLLYFIDYEGTNWYGNSVMRIAEQPHRDWNIANNASRQYDRKIAGAHWVVSYPIGTSLYGPIGQQQEIDNLEIAQNIIRTLEASGAVAIPTMLASYIDDLNSVGGQFASEKRDWRVEIMSDGSSAGGYLIEKLKYKDTLKLRAFGLPERSAIEGQFGTKAEAGEHIDFALTHIVYRGDWFCIQTNKGIVNQLLKLNYGNDAEGTVHVKQKPLTDEAKAFFRQLYIKLLDLPSTEPQEVASIDFKTLKEKLEIPLDPEFLNDEQAADEDAAPVDEKYTLQDVLSSINQTYGASVSVSGMPSYFQNTKG